MRVGFGRVGALTAAFASCALAAAACSSGSNSSPAASGSASSSAGSSVAPGSSSASASPAAKGGSIVVANTSSVQKLDPQVATNFLDFQALGLIYEPLVTLNAQLQLVPDLATSWAFSAGNKVLTFTLRSGVKFDDGSTMTSADVKASLERVQKPSTGAASASYISSVTSIATPTPTTVVLTLAHPDFSILQGFTSLNLAILSAKAIAAGTVATKPDGTGPFVFSSYQPNTSFAVAANTAYWGGAPKLSTVTFRTIPNEQSVASALQAGTVQMGLLTQPQVIQTLGSGNLQVQKELDLSYRALMIQSKGVLSNVNARLAIQCALSRSDVLQAAVLGQGKVVGPEPSGPFASDIAGGICPTQDLALARSYLAKAGMPKGFSFTALTSNELDATSAAQAVAVQGQLSKVGITMSIDNAAGNDYIQRWLKGDFQAAFAENGSSPDPYVMYGRYFGTGANLGAPAGYSSPELQKILAEADQTSSAATRTQLFKDLSTNLVDNAVWIWLFDAYDYTVLSSSVKGYQPLPSGQLTGLATASVS